MYPRAFSIYIYINADKWAYAKRVAARVDASVSVVLGDVN
jgi:hypothetical protein